MAGESERECGWSLAVRGNADITGMRLNGTTQKTVMKTVDFEIG